MLTCASAHPRPYPVMGPPRTGTRLASPLVVMLGSFLVLVWALARGAVIRWDRGALGDPGTTRCMWAGLGDSCQPDVRGAAHCGTGKLPAAGRADQAMPVSVRRDRRLPAACRCSSAGVRHLIGNPGARADGQLWGAVPDFSVVMPHFTP